MAYEAHAAFYVENIKKKKTSLLSIEYIIMKHPLWW